MLFTKIWDALTQYPVAIIPIIGIICYLIYDYWSSRQRSLENAKREYEYKTRQQLYAEIEPLTFQLFDHSLHIINRLKRLTNKNFESSYGSGKSSFYLDPKDTVKFSVYRILLPLVYHEIFKRKMTFLELRENRKFYTIFHLLTIYYWTFGDGAFRRKKFGEPTSKLNKEKLVGQDTIRSDAISLATLEMIMTDGKNPDRPVNFAEFVELYNKPYASGNSGSAIKQITDFYGEKDPMLLRPVLQNMMLAQLCLSWVIHYACVMKKPDSKQLRFVLKRADAPWRTGYKNEPDLIDQAIKYVDSRIEETLFEKYFELM